MNKSTFEKELEERGIELGLGDVRKSRDKALQEAEKELKDSEICITCLKCPSPICHNHSNSAVKEILRRHF